MKLPKTILLSGMKFNIAIGDTAKLKTKNLYGCSSLAEGKVVLQEGMSKENSERVLLHEFVHLILEQNSYIKESENEGLVGALSLGFYQILKQLK